MSEDKVSINDFGKLEIRIGTIIEVSPHPNADKLYVLKIKFDSISDRQIVAGIKFYYKESELLNTQIAVIVNLEPTVIRGVESNGMLLAAGDDKGNVVLMRPEKKISNYAKVR